MKTGKDVIERALFLLGYTNASGGFDNIRDAAPLKRGVAAVIQSYEDLKRIDRMGDSLAILNSMNEEIRLSPETVSDVMPYGVAMLIAQNEGDWDSQALFSSIYSRKRLSVPGKKMKIADVLPRGGQ
mgnify:CR=1 FL=1